MGAGASTKKNRNPQQQAFRSPPKVATPRMLSLPPPPTPPSLPAISSHRRISVQNRSPTLRSQASAKRSNTNLANGNERRTSVRKSSTKTLDSIVLPPIANGNYQSASRATRRSSSIVPAPPMNQSRLSLQSLARESVKPSFRQNSPSIHEQFGRCSKCPHCRRLEVATSTNIIASPEPEWITKHPGSGQLTINMDKYDVEAVKEKIMSRNHHLLGSYDYEPYLVIEQSEGDYDPAKENYYTQPFIARMEPTIQSNRTPFPEYRFLQRHEHRLNKPYSVPLFE